MALPTITFSLLPSTVQEDGGGALVYTFKRTGDLSASLSVAYRLGGTATLKTDYRRSSSSVTFAAGSDTATLTIRPKADAIIEPNETVSVTILARSRYIIGTTGPVVGTIVNDDTAPTPLPVVTMGIASTGIGEVGGAPAVAEDGTANLTYFFTRTGDLTNPLTVNYTASGTATNGADYASLPGSVTFGAGVGQVQVVVNPTADATVEADETVALTLAAGSGYTVGTTGAVIGTITNDDAAPAAGSITINDVTLTEGDSGTKLATYTVTRTGGTAPFDVNYATADGTASAGSDYVATSGILNFGSGVNTQTISVTINGDTTFESDESFLLNLTGATNGATIADTQGLGTISNDDVAPAPAPTITLAAPPAPVAEDGTANLVYTFTRTGGTSSPLSANYTVGGSATIGSDYTGITTAGTTKTVTFAAGSATAVVTVDPIADTNVENDETVALTLAAGSGYTVGTPGAVTGTIRNDDATPPPDTSSGTYIPLSWNDPIFAQVVERTSPLELGPGQSASNVSVVLDYSYSVVVGAGSVSFDRIRGRGREGYRGGSGEQYLSNMYIEAYGRENDHADGLQIYSPGANGRITLRNSTLKTGGEAGTPNSAYWSANDWRGAHVLENVFLSGGVYALRIPGDGGTSVSLKNVYIEKDSYIFGDVLFDLVNGIRPAIVRWENVRLATIENGVLVPGAAIAQPYGIARDYTDAITGTNGADVFAADAAKGNTYVGMNGNDTYRMTDYNQSRLSNMDWLTDFSIGKDVFDGPNASPITPKVLTQKATAFTESAIGTLLNTTGNFPVGGAAIFKQGGIDGERVFLALNSGASTFSAAEDSIVEITGYSGNLSQLQVI